MGFFNEQVLQHVNEHTDVVYTVTADAGGGTVSSRYIFPDFYDCVFCRNFNKWMLWCSRNVLQSTLTFIQRKNKTLPIQKQSFTIPNYSLDGRKSIFKQELKKNLISHLINWEMECIPFCKSSETEKSSKTWNIHKTQT